jgi:phosphoglycerate kinase
LRSSNLPAATRSGGMIFTFYKAQGLGVGSSLVEEDKLELAKQLMNKAKV